MTLNTTMSEGTYPGLIHDVSEARTLYDVIEMVPQIGQDVEAWPVFAATLDQNDLSYDVPLLASQAIINTETGAPYSVTSKRYGILQHRECFSICDALAAKGAAYSQAGWLAQGGTAWIRMAFPDQAIIQADGSVDVVVPSLMVLSDHTGRSSDLILFNTPRLSCNNEITSVKAGSVGRFSIPHRALIAERIEAAHGVAVSSAETMGETLSLFRQMAQQPMSKEGFRTFAARLLVEHRGESFKKALESVVVEHTTRRQQDIDELVAYFDSGNQGAGDTIWGGYQSVTGWLDHRAERLDEAKRSRATLERIWRSNIVGDDAKLKDRAFRRLERAVN